MYFTQNDYRKIEEWLRTRTIKDTQFDNADPLAGSEQIPIIQDGKNKIVGLNMFIKQLSMMELPDFLNITNLIRKGNLFLDEAINSVPVEQRKLGLVITFHSEKGNWVIYQFKGTSLNQWSSLNYWTSIVEEAIEEFVYHPDEEDITGVRDGNRTFLKFKDKDYNPSDFSGMGRIILRKNLVGTEACSIDDEDHFLNVLTQDMIKEENTVYIIQYDFDLDNKTISIPKGCTLWFQGGSINNGTVYLQETAILGAFEFADMGNVKLFGNFNTGQIMTFSDDSYKAKEGGYFIPSVKNSSATPQEDAKQDEEVLYISNPNAYVTETRQELRWWNGEEWILVLDITDYNEIKSIINDLIEKHNAEMSACYKYFKTRSYALEVRMDSAESRLDSHDTTLENHETRLTETEESITDINGSINNIEGDINSIEQNVTSITGDISSITNNISDIENTVNNLGNTINNLEQTITEQIQQYIENNVIGVASVTVNGTKYTPDSNGNINLPDYPEAGGGIADQTVGTLRFTGAVSASYNGSNDVTVNIPSGGGGDTIITAKEPLTLMQGRDTLGVYDGTKPKTIIIPESSGEATSVKGVLTLETAEGSTLGTYNGSEDKTITLPSSGGDTTIITAKETLTIKQGNATLGTYTGETPVTINIPESSGGGGVADSVRGRLKVLDSNNTELIDYNGSTDKTLILPESSQVNPLHVNRVGRNTDLVLDSSTESFSNIDIDLSTQNNTLDLEPLYNGDGHKAVVLVAGRLVRPNTQSVSWSFDAGYTYHPAIKTTSVSLDLTRRCITFMLGKPTYGSIRIASCVANVVDSNKINYDKYDTGNNLRGMPIAMLPTFKNFADGSAQLRIFAWSNNSSGTGMETVSITSNKDWGNLLAFNLVILGQIV